MEYRHRYPITGGTGWPAPMEVRAGPLDLERRAGPIMAGRTTNRDRERERAAQESLRAGFEAPFEKRMAGLIAGLGREAAQGFDFARRAGVSRVLHRAAEPLTAILTGAWEAVMPAFGARLLDAAGLGVKRNMTVGRFGNENLPPLRKDTADDFRRRAAAWIALNSPGRVADISAGIEALILAAIETGVRDNLTAGDISKAIRAATGGEIGRNRAARIARTETHAAAVAAQDEAAEALDLGGRALEREWIAAGEGARPSHVAADGQRRRCGIAFDIGGAKLLRPGDPNGPAREVINCRCVLAYVPLEVEFGG